MKRIIRTVAVLLLTAALTMPVAEARGRNDRGNNGGASHGQVQNRPGNMGRPSGGGNNHQPKPGNSGNPGRPGNQGHQGNPGNNHQPNPGRPGNQGNPGNSHNRPNPNPGSTGRPGGNFWGNNNQGVRPPQGPGPGFQGHGPAHPNRPPQYAWHRPEPPRHWRPSPSWRPFNTILGVALGSAINFTVQALTGYGYNVVSYGPSGVWVSDVPMLNMMWPDAQLFYNSTGGLCGSRFIYSTTYDSWNRYNQTYATLVGTYGAPVSSTNTSSGMEVTWWGTGNQFIRLGYSAEYSPAGALRYYTTLSFGN